MSVPNSATERLCIEDGCGGLLTRADHSRTWRHVARPLRWHEPRPAPREYDPPCRCGLAVAHLAGPHCRPAPRVPRRPLRDVVEAFPRSGRGSLLGGDTSRRVRWWELHLSCGHVMDRPVRYRPDPRYRRGGSGSLRPMSDALPHPRRSRCDDCRSAP